LKEIADFLESTAGIDLEKDFKKKDKDKDLFLSPRIFLKVLKTNNVDIDKSEGESIIKIYTNEGKEAVYYMPFL